MQFTHVVALLGGLALFLYGMQMMGGGLEKAAGNNDKAKEMYKEYVHRFGRHECEIERYYDHRQFMYFYERILQNGERGLPSFVNGE